MGKIEIKKTGSPAEAASLLAGYLNDALRSDQNVLWFISGGSSIPIAHETAEKIDTTDRLRMMIVDDKFTGANTDGVNKTGLLAEQWFRQHDVRYPSYTGELERDGENYAGDVAECMGWADIAIGQFGIGEGMHTGGILPDMPDVSLSHELAVGYMRGYTASITITPESIVRLDMVFINSFGVSKRELVEHFLKSEASIVQEPTQALKEARSIVVSTDRR